jgi:hypothetical protein
MFFDINKHILALMQWGLLKNDYRRLNFLYSTKPHLKSPLKICKIMYDSTLTVQYSTYTILFRSSI